MSPNVKMSASGVDVTQFFFAKLARKNSKISGIPARRAHKKLRALGQRALRMLQNVSEVDRVVNAFGSEKVRVRRRDHANVAPKSRERNANFSELRRASRRKNACIRPACVSQTACRRCTCQTSRQCVQIRRKTRVRRRDHRNFAQKFNEQNFKELGTCHPFKKLLENFFLRTPSPP